MRRIATSVLVGLCLLLSPLARAATPSSDGSVTRAVGTATPASDSEPSENGELHRIEAVEDEATADEEGAPAHAGHAAAEEADESGETTDEIAASEEESEADSAERRVETIEATPIDAAPAAAPVAAAPAEGEAEALADAPAGLPAKTEFHWELHGFLRAGWTQVEQDPGSFVVGQHSGFRLYNARVNVVGGWGEHVGFDFSLDTDQQLSGETNQAPMTVGLRDANLSFKWEGLALTVGQFKTPFNGEFLLSDGDVPFARRSMISEGMRGDESQRVYRFMGLDRQLGAMLGYTLPLGAAAAKFEVAAVNGNGLNEGRNDNRAVALVGRASLGWNGSQIGAGGYVNQRTSTRLANSFDETDLAFDVDAMVNLFGVKLFGMFLFERTEYATTGAGAKTQWGTVASVSRSFDAGPLQLEPAYRFAMWEPMPQDQLPDAGLMDHTAGLNVYGFGLPMRVQLNYTVRVERVARTAPNDLFEAVLQANF